MSNAISFDIFDTCVSRRVAKPADLFFEVGLHFAEATGVATDKEQYAMRFARARVAGERKARELARPKECVTIEEIYMHMQLGRFPGVSSKDAASVEILLERRYIYPIPGMIDRINRFRGTGRKPLFISDMYLPRTTLQPMLLGMGVMREGEKLYVSCDTKLTKSSGNLFRHVLSEERLHPSALSHVGDNPRGDIASASRHGIKSEHYLGAMLNDVERRIAGGKRFSLSPGRSLIAALSRESRLLWPSTGAEPLGSEGLMHGYIAPLLVGYVSWVIDHARRNGTRRLYFVARDGEVMYKIAQRLLADDGDIETRYLFGSRRAWHPASIVPNDSTWIKALLPLGQSHTPTRILQRIALDESSQEEIFGLLEIRGEHRQRQLGMDEASQFIARLADDPQVRSIIDMASESARRSVISYLEQEGLFDDISWALVDSGWSLNCQASLKRILASRPGPPREPVGYYLALFTNRLPENVAGKTYTYANDSAPVFCRHRTMVEHAFTPGTHASTVGYELQSGITVPVVGKESRDAAELLYAKRLQDICVHQAVIVRREPVYHQRLLYLREELCAVACEFLSRPTIHDATALRLLDASPDFFHEASSCQGFCRSLGLRDLYHVFATTVSKRARFASHPLVWPEGSTALSPAYIRLPMTAILWIKSRLARLLTLLRKPA